MGLPSWLIFNIYFCLFIFLCIINKMNNMKSLSRGKWKMLTRSAHCNYPGEPISLEENCGINYPPINYPVYSTTQRAISSKQTPVKLPV